MKGAPKASGLVTDATGARGYVVNFPITLQNLSALSFPSKGAGQLDASAPQEFYDHFWTAPAGTTLATASQMSAAGVVGTNCGPSVAANGLLPDAPSDWTGSCASNLGSAYPVWKITIVGGSYSLTPVDAKGTIITGQIVVWLPEAGVQAAAAANDGVVAPFDNSISSDDASKAVNATTLTPIGVKGSSTAAEPSTTDNSTHFTIGGTPPPPGGSGTSSTWFSHYAQLAANYVELSYTQNGATSWSPDHAMTRSYGANFTTGSAVTPWSGNGLVSRGMPVNMQLYVSTSEPASGTTDAPIHGCLTWNADQVKLRQMPASRKVVMKLKEGRTIRFRAGRFEGLEAADLGHVLERARELGVAGAQLVDLVDRVHDRRVVLVVELAADLRIGEVGQLLAEVHRHLAREGDLLRVRLRLDLADLEPVVAGDQLDDLGGRGGAATCWRRGGSPGRRRC